MVELRQPGWMEDRHICWKCGADYPEDIVICVECGVDLRTGEELKAREEPEEPPAPGRTALVFIGELAPGLFRPVLLVFAIIVMITGLAVMAFGVSMSTIVPLGAIAIGAAGVIFYAHGVSWILGGEFGFLTSVLAELDGKRWLLFFVILWAPVVVVLAWVSYGM